MVRSGDRRFAVSRLAGMLLSGLALSCIGHASGMEFCCAADGELPMLALMIALEQKFNCGFELDEEELA